MAELSDLAGIFQLVQEKLLENKDAINQADDRNHDHGTNMVDIFNVITEAVQSKQGTSPNEQLTFASKMLKQQVKSGTANVYSDGLKNAAEEFSEKQISSKTSIDFVQALLGRQTFVKKKGTEESEDLIGSILSSLSGDPDDKESGFDLSDVLDIGIDVLQAKQSGGGIEALVGTVLSNTKIGQKKHRAASGEIVSRSLLDALTKF